MAILVPSLGDAVAAAVLNVWWVEVNQDAVQGDVLFEIGTEKTIIQVESEVDGTLVEVLVQNGEPVHSGMLVGRMRTA